MIPSALPSTDLKNNLREVKDATRDSFAIITEAGRGRYLFGSTGALDNELTQAAWEEANAERIIEGIEQGLADIARGDYVVGTEAAVTLSNQMREERQSVTHG